MPATLKRKTTPSIKATLSDSLEWSIDGFKDVLNDDDLASTVERTQIAILDRLTERAMRSHSPADGNLVAFVANKIADQINWDLESINVSTAATGEEY